MSDIFKAGGTSSKVVRSTANNFPIFGILTIIFVVGKILGYLTWPWIWVLAPLWGPYAFVITMTFFIVAFALGAAIISTLWDRYR